MAGAQCHRGPAPRCARIARHHCPRGACGLPEPAVRVEGLTRSFDGKAVIEGLDVALNAGEFTALLGRSGCGKSTLLRVLAGLDCKITGTVLVPKRRAVAFQAPRLMPWKRIWRNVLLGLPGKPERAVA